MSPKDTKAIVLEFYQAFDNRDIEQAFNLISPNFTAYMAGIQKPLDAEAFKQFGMRFYSAFADSQHQFEQIIVEDNKVVTCGTFKARHLGEFQGLPLTGKQIKIAVMHIDRVEDGKIVEHWGLGDAQGLMQQLGIIFFPSPKLIPSIIKSILVKTIRR
ncbi:hypothetical protein NIES4102_18750 [Chondrocystis sp. NIES-4102]|nr:hypothetical protein NIES4102_18750 [Chondrocystis sp. NIES-4102]